MKRCIVKSEVASILEAAHNLEGHWQFRMTLRKLGHVYWPNMIKDTADFKAGCLKCGKLGNAQRTQTTSPIVVEGPNELWSIDFFGPFPETLLTKYEAFRCSWPQLHDIIIHSSRYNEFPEIPLSEGTLRFTHCLVVVDYFSPFVWIFIVVRANCAEVVRCLTWLFGIQGRPIGLYTDPGKHFKGVDLQDFLKSCDVEWIPSPTAPHKATGIFEKCIHIMVKEEEMSIYNNFT
ncbi:putative eka-like protein [Erysiphe neolycopersici]|uniref:Putative eka-like protein n=1 Tax=Erysiphe neolycopersici TaxID=212602 RepID=A0A420HDL5_9PEZI|nr:putative eka-like protein [Erysiphe neolycopersici]